MTDFEKDLASLEDKYWIKIKKFIFREWLIEHTIIRDNFKETIWVNKEKLAQGEFESLPINDPKATQYRI